MKRYVYRYVRRLKAQKKMYRQASALITALSVIVSSTVVWQLRGIGVAMSDEDIIDMAADTSVAAIDDNSAIETSSCTDIQESLIQTEDLVSIVPSEKAEASPVSENVPEENDQVVHRREFSGMSASGISVAVSADENAFPDGTVMHVMDIPGESYLVSAAESLNLGTDEINVVAVDISFMDADGTELEPAPATTVQVRIMLPDELQLGYGNYSLLHIDDSGGVTRVDNAEITAQGAQFEAETFSIFVFASDEYVDMNSAITVDGQPVANTADTPYIVYKGGTFKIRSKAEAWVHENNPQGYPYLSTNPGVLSQIESSNTYSETTEDGIVYRVIEREYRADNIGTAVISLTENQQWASSHMYVKVIERPQIYVNTALGERHKDQLHEYLDQIHHWDYIDHPDFFILDQSGNPQYVKNGDTHYYNLNGTDNNNGGLRPYRISEGDVIEMVSYCKPSDKDQYDFEVGTMGTHVYAGLLEKISSSKELVTSGEHKGEYRITAKFMSKNPAGTNKRTGIKLGNDFFYIVVNDNNGDDNIKTHADIEIDDGGHYVFERYSFEADGTMKKTLTKYSAVVSDINSCKIFDKNGSQLKFLKDDGNVADEKKNEGKPVEYVKDDYFRNGIPGSSQFELTSNYLASSKIDESTSTPGSPPLFYVDSQGVYLRGNKNFSLKDAFCANFNVDLQLTPVSETVEVYDGNGNLLGSFNNAVDSSNHIIKNGLDFSLDRQAIIDAYNKCPVRTGLDFTLAASAVMVDFQIKKELVGDRISAGEFRFQLLDGENVIAEAVNDANGIVSFDNVYFNSSGEYRYTVREIKGEGNNIKYATDRLITITASEYNGLLATRIDGISESMKNYRTYTLPETGGIGIVPFIITGLTFISIASVLLVLSKRKEKT